MTARTCWPRTPGRVLLMALLCMGCAAHAQTVPTPAPATATAIQGGSADDIAALRAELAEARALIAAQQRRLDQVEQRLAGLAQAPAPSSAPVAVAQAGSPVADGASAPIRVGEPPADADRAPTVAVLDQQGSVITRKGQLVAEFGLDYTRADRNRAVFRGLSFAEAVLVGVFDINESRQDVLTGSLAARYGMTDRIEIGARVPVIYRSDNLVTVPIAGSTNDDEARTIDNSTHGTGIGDIELSARYQISNGGKGWPFLTANLQATAPTGRDPYSVPRNALGAALKSATGAGFWGITPSITAILPSEPAVLFGTIGYTFNMGKDVDTRIAPVHIYRVDPGNQVNISAGVGLALNDRTSLNFGYNHAWAFGTRTTVKRLDEKTNQPSGDFIRMKSRDLQIGRFLFGVSQRFSDRFMLNWAVEVGATEDAPDVRTSLRIPFTF